MRIPVRVDLPFKTYSGFKFVIGAVLFLVFVIPAIVLGRRHGFDPVVGHYLLHYWISGWKPVAALLLIIFVFSLVFWLDRLEHFYYSKFRRYRRERVKWLDRLTLVMAHVSLPAVVVLVPFLHLYSSSWLQYSITVLPTMLGILSYFTFFSGDLAPKTIPRRGTLTPLVPSYFDIASIAPISKAVEEEVHESLEYLQGGPGARPTMLYLTAGNPRTNWRGLGSFFQNLSKLLDVPQERITLHASTTGAIEFALAESLDNLKNRLQGRLPVVVTTDSEYPHIRRRVLTRFDADVYEAPIAELVWEGKRRSQITEAFLKTVDANKPDIVLLSHVLYWSGSVMDLETIIGHLHSLDRPPLVIVDGAQALGNVEVSPTVFDQVDYYAACCHKWLLVPHAMGILVRDPKRLQEHHGFARFRSLTRPFSSFPCGPDTAGCTIDFEPYFGLNTVLLDELFPLSLKRIAEHNRELCDLFLDYVPTLGVKVIGSAPHGSMAAVSLDGLTEELFEAIGRRGIRCQLLRVRRQPGSSYKVIRFGFHCGFHSEVDVFQLTHAFEEEVYEVQARSSWAVPDS